ncbi:MAG: hypothetical protein JWM86_776 [Thermoleophilia bacterium]|nr:hypothetical protein [Thermoleophilia bacterium]
MAALLALCSSLLWGTGDFLGGRASRTHAVLRVLFWSQAATFTLVWLVVGLGAGAGWLDLDVRTVGIGVLGGMAGVVALGAFYRALAIGPMSVVPPIAAAGVALPVVVGILSGDPPSRVTLGAIVLTVVGIVLASMGEGSNDEEGSLVPTRIAGRTLALCLVAALGFGLMFVAMDAAAGDTAASALVATAGVRLGSFTVLVLAALSTRMRPTRDVTPRSVLGFATIGLFDTAANLTFAVATTRGALEVVAVLGSLYPVVTSALAHVVLGERLGRVQLVGVVAAIAGVAVLASA